MTGDSGSIPPGMRCGAYMLLGEDAGPARAANLDDTRMGKRGGPCRYRGFWKIQGHPVSLEGVIRSFVYMEGAACGGGPPEEPKRWNPLCGGLGVGPHPPRQT